MVDGSADRHAVKECGRAGRGVVQVDDDDLGGRWITIALKTLTTICIKTLTGSINYYDD